MCVCACVCMHTCTHVHTQLLTCMCHDLLRSCLAENLKFSLETTPNPIQSFREPAGAGSTESWHQHTATRGTPSGRASVTVTKSHTAFGDHGLRLFLGEARLHSLCVFTRVSSTLSASMTQQRHLLLLILIPNDVHGFSWRLLETFLKCIIALRKLRVGDEEITRKTKLICLLP